jgi:hypothetical protein
MSAVPTLADSFEHDDFSCITDLIGYAHNNVRNKVCPGTRHHSFPKNKVVVEQWRNYSSNKDK